MWAADIRASMVYEDIQVGLQTRAAGSDMLARQEAVVERLLAARGVVEVNHYGRILLNEKSLHGRFIAIMAGAGLVWARWPSRVTDLAEDG